MEKVLEKESGYLNKENENQKREWTGKEKKDVEKTGSFRI